MPLSWWALRVKVDLTQAKESGSGWVAMILSEYDLPPVSLEEGAAELSDTLADIIFADMSRRERRQSTSELRFPLERVASWIEMLEIDIWNDLGRPTPEPLRIPVGMARFITGKFSE